MSVARANWPAFDGWCAGHHVAPLRLPLDRYLNLIYWWAAVRNAGEQQDIDDFNEKLWMPPLNATPEEIPPESPWSAESETAALSAFAGEFGAAAKVAPATTTAND